MKPIASHLTKLLTITLLFWLIFSRAFALHPQKEKYCDDSDQVDFSKFGPEKYWKPNGLGNLGGSKVTQSSDTKHGLTNWGEWHLVLPLAGRWHIEASIPAIGRLTSKATYRVIYGTQQKSNTISQALNSGKYANITDISISDSLPITVVLDDMTGEGWGIRNIVFDSIKVTYLGPESNLPLSFYKPMMASNDSFQVGIHVPSASKTPPKCNLKIESINGKAPKVLPSVESSVFKWTRYSDPFNSKKFYWDINLAIRLSSFSIDRFSENTVIDFAAAVTDGDGVTGIVKGSYEILTPIIIVRGYDAFGQIVGNPSNMRGGDGTFGQLERGLESRRAISYPTYLLGSTGYRLASSQPDYPTIYNLTYRANKDSFKVGATALAQLVKTAKAKSYSSKVILIGHSKGGLVARSFVQFEDRGASVSNIFCCNTPHSGSYSPYYWRSWLETYSFSYKDLLPIYPWYRDTTGSCAFGIPQELRNADLEELNNANFPSWVNVYILYSKLPGNSTYAFRDGNKSSDNNIRDKGDEEVPLWSLMGRTLEFSSNNTTYRYAPIPNLVSRPNTSVVQIDEYGHTESPNRSTYINYIFSKIYRNVRLTY